MPSIPDTFGSILSAANSTVVIIIVTTLKVVIDSE